MKLIDKDAVLAEIDRIENGLMDAQGNFAYREDEGAYHTLCSLENFINTLEVKEVDLDAIVNEAFDKYSSVDGYGQLVASFNRAELYLFINEIARKGGIAYVSNKMGGINNALSQDILAMKSVDEAITEVEEKAKAFTEAHKGEDSETILAEMRGEETVSEIDFEQELYKYFGQVKDFTLGMRIAKRFYEIGRNHQEPVSEDLISEIRQWFTKWPDTEMEWSKEDVWDTAEHFALWQKQQIMKDAVDGTIEFVERDGMCKPTILYEPSSNNKMQLGEEVKVIIIKQ